MRYPRHDTYLWGAAADDGRPPSWLMAAETTASTSDLSTQFRSWTGFSACRTNSVQPCLSCFRSATTSRKFSSTFHMRRRGKSKSARPIPTGTEQRRRIAHSPVLWKGYAISYVKGKSFDVWRLADPEKPYRGKKLHTSAHIRIYDVFGFFQSSFSAVVKSMVDSGRATKEEADFIAEMKDRRDQFANEDIEQIKAYTTLELRLLARMMGDLRTGFEETGLHLRHWHGAGAAASALIESQKLKMHYGRDIAASNISPQQTAAHHAYYGGRIELLKQGYVENRAAACLRHRLAHIRQRWSSFRASLPASGSASPEPSFARGSLSELRAAVEAASCLSMFKIRFQFPTYERYHSDARKAVFIPFYPLPYRDKRGGILFPASGYGWYTRDDVLAAISWLGALRPRLSAAAEQTSPNDGVRDRRGLDF